MSSVLEALFLYVVLRFACHSDFTSSIKSADAISSLTVVSAVCSAGNGFFKNGDYRNAIARYSDAIAADPTNHAYWSNRRYDAWHMMPGVNLDLLSFRCIIYFEVLRSMVWVMQKRVKKI